MARARVSLIWLLAAVTVLASLMFVVSVGAIGRLIHLSEQRYDRGRDLLQRELVRLTTLPDTTSGPVRLTVLGLRGGVVDDRGSDGGLTAIQTGISNDIDHSVSALGAAATHEHPEIKSIDVEGGTLFF